ncbi:MAG TPA: c-type cytochrome [Bryobacteraceae bacterium]|nr:c-type cytochrome [Bryobacteraceae bacterium]
MNLRGVSVLVFTLAASTAHAQHGYTPSDIEEGGRQYRLNCITCHGPDGNLVTGIDLGRGKFRRASTDDDIVNTILNGVPGAGMPAFEMILPRAQVIVAYLRSLASEPAGISQAAANGNAARGKAIFEGSAGCSSCHRVRAVGGTSGPDLSEIGLAKRAIEIETAILKPGPGKALENRPVRLVRKNGAVIQGLLLNEDTFTVQITDAKGALASIPRSELAEFAFLDKSLMPSYQGKLNPQELADVIAYLASLKGAPVQ